jgi:hypothetical protein
MHSLGRSPNLAQRLFPTIHEFFQEITASGDIVFLGVFGEDGSMRYESHPILRAVVPGQVSYDRAITDFGNHNYAGGAVNLGLMAGEQVLTVLTFVGAGSIGNLWPKGLTSSVEKQGVVTAADESAIGAKLQEYGGPGGGHHVPAKSAFKGSPGYDPVKALAIPNSEMMAQGIDHYAVTGAQRTGYRALFNSGEPLTWETVKKVEVNALMKGGMEPSMAKSTVKSAIDQLKQSGVTGPTRIPWSN